MEVSIYKFLESISSQMKLKILVHLWKCHCNSTCVNSFVDKFKTSQANISQHLKGLRKSNILIVKKDSRKRFYIINSAIKEKFDLLFKEIVKFNNLEKYFCGCVKFFDEKNKKQLQN